MNQANRLPQTDDDPLYKELANKVSWFTEYHFEGEVPEELLLTYQYAIARELAHTRSEFQDIRILENPVWGRNMVIDNFMMVTENDEFTYHEMLAHVPLVKHGAAKTVLIIGGGDGGLAREVLKHPSVTRVDLVELDAKVVEVCRQHLPTMGCAFDDARVKTHFMDGIAFVHNPPTTYDIILVDSTDPLGPGKVLYQTPFYQDCRKSLNPNGLFAAQGLSPYLQVKEQDLMFDNLRQVFAWARPFLTTVPTYMGGLWTFAMAGDGDRTAENFDTKLATKIAGDCTYYNADMQRASFCLPNFIQNRLLQD